MVSPGDGGTLEYVFESDDRDVLKTVTKEKAAEIAAEFMTRFTASRSEHWRRRSCGRSRCRSGWSVSPRRSRGPLRAMWFVVVLPNGTVVEPRIEKRL